MEKTGISRVRLFQLWALPGLIGGSHFLFKAWNSGSLEQGLFGAGLLLGGLYALRHDLFDFSSPATSPTAPGKGAMALLGSSVLLVFAAFFVGIGG